MCVKNGMVQQGNEVKSEEEPNQNVPSVSPSPVREEDRVSPEESLLAQVH